MERKEVSEEITLVTFSLDGQIYGLPVDKVEEVIPLPEISFCESSSPFVEGVIDLRGEIIPLFNLKAMLGMEKSSPSLTDPVVVVRDDRGVQAGLIVNALSGVVNLPAGEISPASRLREEACSQYVSAMGRWEGELLRVLDPEKILGKGVKDELFEKEGKIREKIKGRLDRSVVPREIFKEEEKNILAERRIALSRKLEEDDQGKMLKVLTFDLGDECYGIPTEFVLEIAKSLPPIARVPCVPGWIAGVMNLRGDILTVVDLKKILEIGDSGDSPPGSIVVVQEGEKKVALLSENIRGVSDIPFGRIDSPMVPERKGYLKGEAVIEGAPLIILDMERLLSDERLVVDEGEE